MKSNIAQEHGSTQSVLKQSAGRNDYQLPQIGFLRLKQIIGDSKARPPIPALLPIGRTTFLNRVKDGIYPKPVRLGKRSIAWRVIDINNLVETIGGDNE